MSASSDSTPYPSVSESPRHTTVVAAYAELHNARIELEINEGYPPVINAPHVADIARIAAARVVGDGAVVEAEFPSMGSEDFSFYLEHVPGAFVRYGARHPDWQPIPLHSPAFDVDERVLGIGTRFMSQLAHVAHDNIGVLTRAL